MILPTGCTRSARGLHTGELDFLGMRGQQDVPGDRWAGGIRGAGGAAGRAAGAGTAMLKAAAALPAEFFFWIGFALPFGPVTGLARTVLVLLGWPSLRRCQAQPAGGPAQPPAINRLNT